MEYTIKQLADRRSPAPQRGAGGQGAGGEAAASAMAKELRQPRGGGGQVRPPRPGGAPPDSATTSTAERAPPRGEARARAGTRPAAGGDPRQPTGKHARDRDQGGAGGQQTATAHTSRGDLRTRGGASRPRPAAHRRSPEQAQRRRGNRDGCRPSAAAGPGAAPNRKKYAGEVSTPLAHLHVVLRPGPPGPGIVVRHVLHRRLA